MPQFQSMSKAEILDSRLADYAKAPDAGSSWEEVEARTRAGLRQ